MMATQNNVPEAEKFFSAALREEKELGYHEPPSIFVRWRKVKRRP